MFRDKGSKGESTESFFLIFEDLTERFNFVPSPLLTQVWLTALAHIQENRTEYSYT